MAFPSAGLGFECCSCNLYDQSLSVNYQRSIVLLYLIASVQCINIDESGQINYLDKVEQINLCIAHSFRGVLLIIFCIICFSISRVRF
jgi:hypothetical protein